MKRSTERFLTTHTGSLPRPDDLIRMMYAKEEGVPVEREALATRVRTAVAEVVKKQADAGVDLINDGELSKPSYATYIKDRLNGFGGTGNTFVYQDLAEFPKLAQRVFGDPGPLAAQDAGLQRPDQRARRQGRARGRRQSEGRAGPGEGRGRLHERRLARRGVAVLPQRPLQGFRDLHLRHRRRDARRIRDRRQSRPGSADRLPRPRHGPAHPIRRSRSEGIPQAHPAPHRGAQPRDQNIPPEQLRLHLCWGNYEGPHHHDVPLADIIDIVFTARPAAISLEAANPRHAHEWVLFETVKLPAGKC